jgi:hypothetical protein
MDLHHLLLAGLPAHSALPLTADVRCEDGEVRKVSTVSAWAEGRSSIAHELSRVVLNFYKGISEREAKRNLERGAEARPS